MSTFSVGSDPAWPFRRIFPQFCIPHWPNGIKIGKSDSILSLSRVHFWAKTPVIIQIINPIPQNATERWVLIENSICSNVNRRLIRTLKKRYSESIALKSNWQFCVCSESELEWAWIIPITLRALSTKLWISPMSKIDNQWFKSISLQQSWDGNALLRTPAVHLHLYSLTVPTINIPQIKPQELNFTNKNSLNPSSKLSMRGTFWVFYCNIKQ